jgi:SAM-dependent methyltransferase
MTVSNRHYSAATTYKSFTLWSSIMSGASISNIEWCEYGKLDYGVSHDLTHGIEEWRELREVLHGYGISPAGTCVEIGCGAGRLTNAVAADFEIVHACDVSDDRLRQVRKVPNGEKIIPHLLTGATLPLGNDSADLCISTHVFQHITDLSVVRTYFAELYRVLCPGGCILIHMPFVGAHGISGKLHAVAIRRLKETTKRLVLALTRMLIVCGWRRLPWKIDHYTVFEYREVHTHLKQLGFWPIELRLLSRDGIHSYVFATKSTVYSGVGVASPGRNQHI